MTVSLTEMAFAARLAEGHFRGSEKSALVATRAMCDAHCLVDLGQLGTCFFMNYTFMNHYKVRFIKDLCDDTGHVHRCIEGIIDIRRARDRDRAVQAAKRKFERMKRISHWNQYADAFEVEESASVNPTLAITRIP